MQEVSDIKKKKRWGKGEIRAEFTSQAKPSVSKGVLSNTAVFLKILLEKRKILENHVTFKFTRT